jgi:hypothetical protein
MTNHTIHSVKVGGHLTVTDEAVVDSTSSTDALHLLFEATKDDVNITETCAYDWRSPFVELGYDSLEAANEQSAADFEYLTCAIREIYAEQEKRRKECEALQTTYDNLDQIRCDITNGNDRRNNEGEVDKAMGLLMGKMDSLQPINAAW